mmetsp:Transcript_5586/g.8230  ORF Transcript_5586/g.8230 Transcript_5586/m.8230 type:complete len:391 (+) Transcript_5586:102-1274(+)
MNASRSKRASRKPTSMLQIGTVIKNKWKITQQIGRGAFGETYCCKDLHSNTEVAVKIEKLDNKKMVLRLEVIALKKIQSCQQVVRYIHSGRQDDFNFLVMELLGSNIAELRKNMPEQRFSMVTTAKLGIQMIQALRGVHELGFIHRDVKPSNFVVGKKPQHKNQIFLIDFGLARKYRLASGEIRPPRKQAGFRGTARYASTNSHRSRELSRRDDLWSVFYVIVEFAVGQLPWRKIKSKEKIGELKEQLTKPSLVKNLPKEFNLILEHLNTLRYADEPDYDRLVRYLETILHREDADMNAPWDWEIRENHRRSGSHHTGGSSPAIPPVKQVHGIGDNQEAKKQQFSNIFQNEDQGGQENPPPSKNAEKYREERQPSSKDDKKKCCAGCVIM